MDGSQEARMKSPEVSSAAIRYWNAKHKRLSRRAIPEHWAVMEYRTSFGRVVFKLKRQGSLDVIGYNPGIQYAEPAMEYRLAIYGSRKG